MHANKTKLINCSAGTCSNELQAEIKSFYSKNRQTKGSISSRRHKEQAERERKSVFLKLQTGTSSDKFQYLSL